VYLLIYSSPHAKVQDRPRRVLPRRPTPEVVSRHQNLGTVVRLLVEHEIRVGGVGHLHVVIQKKAKISFLSHYSVFVSSLPKGCIHFL